MGSSCSIVARCRNQETGKLTNKVSQLHRDLLGLGKIAQHFDRQRANEVLHLSQSKTFLDRYKDELIFDSEEANREPIIASMYEVASRIMPEVTIGDMRNLLAEKYKEGEYDYQEAYDKMINFNKAHQGSHIFMSTIEALENGKYRFRIAYNAKEEQEALIRTIADKELADEILKRLENLGVGVTEGVRSFYNTKGPVALANGLKGIIQIKNGAYNNIKDLASETGHFIFAALGENHPLAQRLLNAIKNNPIAVRELLGDEEYNKYLNTPNQNKEFAGHIIGLYLEQYQTIAPRSFLQKVGHLIQRAIDWCKAHIPFRNNDLEKAIYDAKYSAYKMAKDFMGEDFKGTLENALSADGGKGEELFGDINLVFNGLRNMIKDFHLLTAVSKKWSSRMHHNYREKFNDMMDALQNLQADKKTVSEATDISGTSLKTVEENAAKSVIELLRFLESEISQAQVRLEWAINGKVSSSMEPLTINQRAQIISHNQHLLDTCLNILKMQDQILDGINDENRQKTILRDEFQTLTSFTTGINLTAGKPSLTRSNYTVAIHSARLAMATALLTQINGNQFLAMTRHCSIDSWKDIFSGDIFRGNKYINLQDELLKTNINPSAALWSRWIDSMADNSDIINQMIYDLVEQKKHEANLATLDYKDRLKDLYDDLGRKGIRNTEIFYERESLPAFVKDKQYRKGDKIALKKDGSTIIDYFEFTEDFKGEKKDVVKHVKAIDKKDVPRGRKSGNLVSDRNWGDWERLWQESKEAFDDKFYEQHKNEGIFASKSEMYSNATYLLAFGGFAQDWHSKYSTKVKIEDPDHPGEYLKDEEGYEIEKYAPITSKDFKNSEDAKNAEYLFDSTQLADLDPKAQEWFQKYLNLKRELDRKLPKGATNMLGLRAPQFKGTHLNNIRNLFDGGTNTARRMMNMSLRHWITYNVSQSPDDIEYGGDNNTYDVNDVYGEDGSVIFDTAHANALQSIERLPLYGIRKFKGDMIDDLSTDLMYSTLAYAAMATSYEALSSIVDSVEETANLLKDRKVDNDFGVSALRSVDEPASYGRLQDYIKQQVYNKYSDQQKSVTYRLRRKITSKLARLGSLWFLGWNLHSALTNAFTGLNEMIKEVGGEEMNFFNFLRANVIFFRATIGGWKYAFTHLTEKGGIVEIKNKLTLFSRHMDIQNDNQREFRNWHIETVGWSTFMGYSLSSIALWIYSATDKWMQTIPVLASALHTKLVNKSTEKEESLWDAYEVVIDSETHQRKLQLRGGYENWLIKDKNLEAIQRMMKEEEEMLPEGQVLETKKLEAIYQQDASGNFILKDGHKVLKDIYIPWDVRHENRFRTRARAINNRLHGVYNTGDDGAYTKLVLGAAIASLKKYAIGLIDRRFSRARYDFRIQDYRQGSYVTMLNLFVDSMFGTRATTNNKIINHMDEESYFKHWYSIPYKALTGLFKFAYLTSTGGIFNRDYLRSRGFSENQINNISRFWGDMMLPLILKALMHFTSPDDEDAEEEDWYDKLLNWRFQDIPWLAEGSTEAYSWILQNLIPMEVAPDEETLSAEHMKETAEKYHQIPFSQRAIWHYQIYRALIEQEAYNPAWYPSMFGELKTLTSNNIPFLGALMDMIKLAEELSEHKTPEEIEQMMDDADTDQKANNIEEAYDNPLGKETFIRGVNKGYYKAAKHVLRTSLTRTPEMWMTGYKSKESMEFWRGAGLGLDDN